MRAHRCSADVEVTHSHDCPPLAQQVPPPQLQSLLCRAVSSWQQSKPALHKRMQAGAFGAHSLAVGHCRHLRHTLKIARSLAILSHPIEAHLELRTVFSCVRIGDGRSCREAGVGPARPYMHVMCAAACMPGVCRHDSRHRAGTQVPQLCHRRSRRRPPCSAVSRTDSQQP